MKTENGDSIYRGKDGRLRIYVRATGKTISYPKYLMEKELGRELNPDEFVHHVDSNPLNNEITNLKIMTSSEHASMHMTKYYDTTAICGWCGKEFLWTALQQQRFYSERRTGRHASEHPFCSRKCSGQYGRRKQIENDENCYSSNRKLTDEQVRYIREVYTPYDKEFGSRALGKRFGVDRTVIDYVVKGKTYKNLL